MSLKVPYIPIHIRPVPATILVAVSLFALYAGLVAGSGDIPMNDKVQHTICFFFIGLSLYWVLELSKRRAEQLTLVLLVSASIGSEILQAYSTVRVFDPLDILANLIGSGTSLALNTTFHSRMLRRRRDAKYSALTQHVELGDLESGAGTEDEAPVGDKHGEADGATDHQDVVEYVQATAADPGPDRDE